jgi:hypothetical protein
MKVLQIVLRNSDGELGCGLGITPESAADAIIE